MSATLTLALEASSTQPESCGFCLLELLGCSEAAEGEKLWDLKDLQSSLKYARK